MIRPIASEPDAILYWLKDETFYSLCSRQHYFLGHLDTSSTLAWLFGSSRYAMTHDFPGNLDALNNHTATFWGDVTSIIHEHTILPMFCPFQSKAQIDAVESAMRSPSIGSMKYRLGLLTGRFGAEHPLKACTSCIAEDRIAHGVAYWHLTHQFPGVVLCPTHGLPLRECMVNRPWSGRFRWVLPCEEWLEPDKPPATSGDVLFRFGAALLDLAAYGNSIHFDPLIVSAV